MRRFPSRFSVYQALLSLLMVLLVAAFQGYWLSDTYQLKKLEFLRRVGAVAETQLQAILVSKISSAISLHRTDSASIPLSSLLSRDTLSRHAGDDGALLSKVGGKGVESVSLKVEDLKSLKDDTGSDSLLYNALRGQVDELRSGNFRLQYDRSGVMKSVIPAGSQCVYTDDAVELQWPGNPEAKFRICTTSLPGIILKKMWGAFLFSTFYLALCLSAVVLLFRASRQRKRLHESKAGFTQNMTHELKIPISTLYLATESLENLLEAAPADARRYTGILRTTLNKLSALVDAILNTARLQQARVMLNRQPQPLQKVVGSSLRSLDLYLSEQKAEVSVRIPPADCALLDATAMELALVNLIENAVKYSPGDPRISIVSKRVNGSLILSVSDNGPGIPVQHWEEVFQPYFRVPEADLHTVKGFGLGLSQVRDILRLHGGTARIAASAAGGTTVELKLPAHDC